MTVSVNGIDHLVIRVRDLDASEDLYRKLGFDLTPRGFHAGRGSANHTAPLSGGNYFELLCLPPGGADASSFPDVEGLAAIALAPDDSRRVHTELAALGYQVEPPRDLARPVNLPDGVHEARFLNASFPRIAPEKIRVFACQHLTRDLVWRPEWETHANGAQRLVEAIVVHSAPASLRATWAGLFGEAIRDEADGFAVALGEDKVSFATPRGFRERYPGIPLLADLSDGWFAGAAFRVASLSQAEDVLSRAGIRATRTPAGSLVVAPADAAGALLEFIAVD